LQNDFGAITAGLGGASLCFNGEIEHSSYNPATIVNITKLNYSIGFQYTKGELYSRILGDTTPWFTESEVMPYLLGFAFPLNEFFSTGITTTIPYRMEHISDWMEERTSQHPTGTGKYFRYIESKRVHSINGIIGWKVNDNLSLGINLPFIYERYKLGFEYRDNSRDNRITTGNLFGLEPCFGIKFSPKDYIVMGMSFKKGFLKGGYIATYTNYDSVVSYQVNINEEETLPFTIYGGLIFQISRNLTLNSSVEFIRWSGISFSTEEDYNYYERYDPHDSWKLHYGIEYILNPTYTLRSGFYIDPYPYHADYSDWDQLFLTAGVGVFLRRFEINMSTVTSNLIDVNLKKETQIFFSLTYR